MGSEPKTKLSALGFGWLDWIAFALCCACALVFVWAFLVGVWS